MAVPTPHPQQGPRAVLSRWCSTGPLGAEDRPLARQRGGVAGRPEGWRPGLGLPAVGPRGHSPHGWHSFGMRAPLCFLI